MQSSNPRRIMTRRTALAAAGVSAARVMPVRAGSAAAGIADEPRLRHAHLAISEAA